MLTLEGTRYGAREFSVFLPPSNLSSKFKLFCVINGEQYGKVGKSPSKL